MEVSMFSRAITVVRDQGVSLLEPVYNRYQVIFHAFLRQT